MAKGSPPFEAVLFDLFGTLVPNLRRSEYELCKEEMAEILGAPHDRFGELWRATFKQRMNGRLRDGPEMFRGIVEELGLRADSATLEAADRARHEFILARLVPKDGALECLRELRGRGLGLALVTDCSSGTPAMLDRTPLGEFFTVRAASALLGTTKPDPVMYRHAMDGLGVEGGRCLYVGDGNSFELPGAKRHGMTTVWVDNGADQNWRHDYVPEGDFTVTHLGEIPGIAGRGPAR